MITIRKLRKDDYHNNYLGLMNQLTSNTSNSITNIPILYIDFCKQFDMTNSDIYVIEEEGRLIGSGTILIEYKFIHGLSKVAHIEDIVMDNGHRGMGLGKMLINYLITCAKDEGCYKVILNCSTDKVEFYKRCGFKQKNTEMSLYFEKK